MNILITGNMGYVGPGVAAHLREVFPEARLVGVDNGWFAHCLTSHNILPEIALDEQWFRDVRSLQVEDLKGFDAIVHLAAVSNDPMGNRFEAVTDTINRQASIRLAELAVDAGVRRFIFASSCSVYGVAEDGRARSEQDSVNPLTAYARSKIGTEEGLSQLKRNNLVTTSLRFATACGMSDRLRLDLVLNDFVAAALATGTISVLSDGTPWRPLIHVKDMARAIEWALVREADENGDFLRINVGSDEWNYQVRDLAHAVARILGGIDVSINAEAPPDRRSYRVDFGLYRQRAPKHQPQETLDSTIAGLRDGLRAIKFSDPEFRQSNLIRLRVLERHLESQALAEDLRWRRKEIIPDGIAA